MATMTSTIPPDNLQRNLALARPNGDPNLPHFGLVGDTYTILLTGEDTAGRYCLIDMLVPPGGGPPPHRHDFEEMFTVLDGEIELTFRGVSTVATAEKRSTCPLTPRTSSGTSPNALRDCCVSARPPARRSSSRRSACRSRTERRLR